MRLAEFGGRLVRKSRMLHQYAASHYFVAVGKADPDLVFIIGTARSGTTWLAEILSEQTRRRLIFEPFLHHQVPQWPLVDERPYIHPSESLGALIEPARRILAGDVRSDWSDGHNSRLLTRGRLIKDIRANLMIGWLYQQFGPWPIILLLRHPAAVASSWKRQGWKLDSIESCLKQEGLLRDHLAPYTDAIHAPATFLERVTQLWCVEQLVLLRQFLPTQLRVVYYENLVLHPVEELDSLRAVMPFENPAGARLARPSATTLGGLLPSSPRARAFAWKDRLTLREMETVRAVMHRFGLDEVYGDDGSPRVPPGVQPEMVFLSEAPV